jgi:hypothetical protein
VTRRLASIASCIALLAAQSPAVEAKPPKRKKAHRVVEVDLASLVIGPRPAPPPLPAPTVLAPPGPNRRARRAVAVPSRRDPRLSDRGASGRAVTPKARTSPKGGGDVMARIRQCESKSDYQAANASSSASGGWQIIDSTWGGFGGYKRAKDAPPGVQDAKAAQLVAARGTQPWNASRKCWAA